MKTARITRSIGRWAIVLLERARDGALFCLLLAPYALTVIMERETGFEPATSPLARSHSTTELFPPLLLIILRRPGGRRQPSCAPAK